MSFLHAWAIALAVSVAVPLILHLRRRQTDRRIAFPALRYLSRAEDARSRSLVASDVLLLATRIALILALVIAAAGLLLGRGGAGDHRPTDLALVVDNSASVGRMVGDRPLFDVLVERAGESLSATRPEDRVWVFPTVGPPLAAGVSGARASDALLRLELADGGADLREAVVRATAALPADGDRVREVQLLSDLQASALTGPAESGGDVPIVALIPPPVDEPNDAIADVELTGGSTVPSGVGHGVVVTTSRAGAETTSGDEASVRLQVDGRIAGAARIPWGSTGTLGLPRLDVGTHEGRVEVDPSGTRADDLRYFAIRVVPPPGVRFVGPDSSFAGFGVETLRLAGRLSAEGGSTVTLIDGVPPNGLGSLAGEAGPRTMILLPPADPVDVPAFNQLLSGLGVGWTLRVDPERGSLAIEEPDASFSFSGIRVRERYLLRPGSGSVAAGDSVILRTEDGEPWLIRTGAGANTVLMLASPFSDRASDLPTHPAVIPFLEALLVQWSHLAGWPASDFDAGEALTLPAWATTVVDPDGVGVSVEPGGRFTPDRTGIYRVEGRTPAGGPRSAHFAVNVPVMELDPTTAGTARLEELYPDRDVFSGGPDRASWVDETFRARRGRDTAPWLLALALALAALELFLATPGRARKAADGGRWRRGEAEIEAGTGAT